MRLEFGRERNDQQWGGDARISGSRRWVRLALYIGTPPGSHIGFWRTRVADLRGWNLRIGRRYAGPTLTLMLHTRPSERVTR